MPAENWYTISGATTGIVHDAWTLGAGANKNVAVQIGGGRTGAVTHDDDTSYVDATGAQRQCFNADWPGPIIAFTSLTCGFRLKETAVAAQSVSQEWCTSGGTLSATFNTTDPGGYATVGPIDVAALRPGGGSWVPADFADNTAMQPCIVSNATAVRVTSVFGVLTYTPPVGGFVFLLGLGPLVVLPCIESLQKLMAHRSIASPRQTKWLPGELQAAWRDIREHVWPSYFHIGGLDAYTSCAVG